MQCHHAMHPTITIPQAIGSNLTRQNQGQFHDSLNIPLRSTHDSLGVSEVESQLSQWHAKVELMIPLILPSTCLTIFAYHLNDINQRCLRNAPLKIVARLKECPSQDRCKA
ncbi:hypothetical protein GQ457_13G014770 [Hibiscus cannabinus]